MSQRDPRGYYAALGLSPGANEVEIGMAFRARKRAYLERRLQLDISVVQAAYETLRDPRSRKDYDEGKPAGASRRRKVFSLAQFASGRQIRIAGGALAVALAVFAAVQHGPAIRGAFVRFEPGDALVDVHSGRPFGEVARYDDSHAFPNGRSARAYLVELEDGAEKWYPAQDLERNCATR